MVGLGPIGAGTGKPAEKALVDLTSGSSRSGGTGAGGGDARTRSMGKVLGDARPNRALGGEHHGGGPWLVTLPSTYTTYWSTVPGATVEGAEVEVAGCGATTTATPSGTAVPETKTAVTSV